MSLEVKATRASRNDMIRMLAVIANVVLAGRDFTDAEGVKHVRPGQRPEFGDTHQPD